MVSDVTCRVSDRLVFISNLGVYNPFLTSQPLIFSITGIINPNKISNANTDYFLVATKRTYNNIYLDKNEKAFVLESEKAAGWNFLYNISASNFFTRLKTDYLFNFTISESLPPTNLLGRIFIDFPYQFDIKDKSLTCDSPTAGFSSLTCSIKSNRLTVEGNKASVSGIILLYVRGIDNPVETGQIDNIYVKTYDGFRKKILETTFLNTDPFTFSFTYPGPLFTINGGVDNITVLSGTQSDIVFIVSTDPCLLNLSFKSSTSGFGVVPSSVPLSVGDYTSSFRVSAPPTVVEGTYYIYWDTLNDLTPAMYTALKKTPLRVIQVTEATRSN